MSRLQPMVYLLLSLISMSQGVYGQSLRYQVPSNAPALSEQVRQALAQWQAVEGGNVEASQEEQGDAAGLEFRLDDANLLGPDTMSLTVIVRDPQQGIAQQTRILLNQASQWRARALLYEWGRLLELSDARPEVVGVLNPRIDPEQPLQQLSQADTRALLEAGRYLQQDITRDGNVDFYDLLRLAENYGREGARLPGDFNNDGRVDAADLAILKENYQFASPAQTAPTAADSRREDAIPDTIAVPPAPVPGTPPVPTVPPQQAPSPEQAPDQEPEPPSADAATPEDTRTP